MNNKLNEKMSDFVAFLNEIENGNIFRKLSLEYVVADTNRREVDNVVYLDLSLVGMKKNDVSIELVGDILTVVANVNENSVYKKFQCNYKNRFKISDDIDAKNINAEMTDGILTITLHKKDNVKEATKININ